MEGIAKEAEADLRKLLGTIPDPPPVQRMLGATLVDVGEGRATFEMHAGEDMHNLVRVVHGGVITSLCELAASTALMTALDDDEAFTIVSQSTNYERPVVDDDVRATASILRRGSRISFLEVVARDSDETEVARAEYTALSQAIQD